MFQAVQDGLEAQRTLRRARLATSSGLLAGRLYDDRGNRLTPSHSNKRGLRYRYYDSQAVLQNRKEAAGSVTGSRLPIWKELGSLPFDRILNHSPKVPTENWSRRTFDP